jgi:hypothetical protein
MLVFLSLLLGCGGCGGCAAVDCGCGPTSVTITALEPIEIFARPDSADGVWSILPPGTSVEVLAIDAEGWLGFDPGVAQAGNTGSFRYRWIAPDGPYSITGDLLFLEPVWAPSSGVTYAMAYEPVMLYLEPDSLSEIVDSLPASSAAAIIEVLPGWFRLDPVNGPDPGTAPGWAQAGFLGISE